MYEINSTYENNNNDSDISSSMNINLFFGKDYDPKPG